jgi:isoleucyl-tRNA synthetase
MIRDVDGVKMSKSLGNIITPDEMVDKHGADVLRYYMCQNNAGQDVRFSWDEAALKGRHLKILWNVHKLLLNLMQETGINPTKVDIPEEKLAMAEQYMFSKLHSTMQQVTELFDTYHLDETVVPLEDLFLELSRTYIQMVRDKSALGSKEEKEVVVYTLYTVLLEFLKMFSILCPFICEAIFLNLKDALHLPEESISHYPWPTVNKEIIDTHLEQEMSNAKNLIQGILFAREKAQLGVRWPVKEVVVIGKELSSDMQEVIKKQTNVKTLTFTESLPGVKLSVKPDYAKIGPAFGKLSPQVIAKITEEDINTLIEHINAGGYEFLLDKTSVKVTKDMLIIEQQAPDGFIGVESKSGWIYLNTERSTELDGEGLARELMRKVQDFRKKVGLQKPDRVLLFVKVNGHQNKLLHAHQQEMQEKVGAKVLKISLQDPLRRHQHEVQVTIKDQKISVWLSRVG